MENKICQRQASDRTFFTKSVPRNDCVSVQISEEVFFLRLNEVSVLLLANYLVNYASSDRASKTTFSIGV